MILQRVVHIRWVCRRRRVINLVDQVVQNWIFWREQYLRCTCCHLWDMMPLKKLKVPMDCWEDKTDFISLWSEEGLPEKLRSLELVVHLSKRYWIQRIMIGAVWIVRRDLIKVWTESFLACLRGGWEHCRICWQVSGAELHKGHKSVLHCRHWHLRACVSHWEWNSLGKDVENWGWLVKVFLKPY